MANQVSDLSERQVQELIADHPWLLSIDYELVPGLANKGMEKHVSDRKRVDLILRDRRTGRPVLIEFKAVPLKRENIGQILEYRASCIQEISDAESLLAETFGEFLAAPILVLVVPTCTTEARLACNLSGIEVYEYLAKVGEWTQPTAIRTFDEFKASLTSGELPFTIDRHEHIHRIYRELREYFVDEIESEWTNFRSPSGEYFPEFNSLFVNKWIYPEQVVSIGLYEEIFSGPHRVIFELCSAEKEPLEKCVALYREQALQPANGTEILCDLEGWYRWQFVLPTKLFFDAPKETIEHHVDNYYTVMDALGWFE